MVPPLSQTSAEDAAGALIISGEGAQGTAAPANILQVGGSDGTSLRAIKVDSNGSQYAIITSPLAAAAGITATVGVTGGLNVSLPAGTLFADSFDSVGLDTTNRWTLATAVGGTDTQSLGVNTLATTTSASSAVQLASQPSFNPAASFYSGALYVQYEATLQTNTHRFWGFGTPAVSFTASTPLLNATGFEIDSSANLNAVVYSNGTKIFTSSLNAYKSINPQLYVVVFRGDAVFFFINTFEVPVAAAVGYTLDSLTLPFRVHMINGTTPPASAPSLAVSSVGVVDSNPSAATNLSDGTYQWRKATIKPTSVAALSTDPALVVSLSPNRSALSPASPTAASVGVATASVVAANTNRKGLTLVNTSINRISLGLGVSAVLNSGITLFPGGVWVMDGATFTTAAINAIAGAAASNLAIQEFS